MNSRIIGAALVLGLGAVTFALAQPGTDAPKAGSEQTVSPADRPCDGVALDRTTLHVRVAKLRAEVELLQLEHDATKALLSDRLKDVVVANAETIGEIDEFQVAKYYMRMGAEKVGKAADFDAMTRDDRAAIEEAIGRVRGVPTELNRKKEAFLRLSTELNRKKIELVELETKLDGSM